MSASCWLLVASVGALLALVLWRTQRRAFATFEMRNVQFVEPWPIVGNMVTVLFGLSSYTEGLKYHYDRLKHLGIYGSFYFDQPVFMLTDAECIKRITVSDFDHFVDHRQYISDAELHPMFSRALFQMNGERWREMRTLFAGALNGTKMRAMFDTVAATCDRLTTQLLRESDSADRPNVVEMKDLAKRYMIDVIAASAFGYQVDSRTDPNNIFSRVAEESQIFHSGWNVFKWHLAKLFPYAVLLRWLGWHPSNTSDSMRFYHRLVHDTIAFREQHNITRKDLINDLLEARRDVLDHSRHAADPDDDRMQAEPGNEDICRQSQRSWDELDVTSQCVSLFLSGAEKCSTLLSLIVQELVEHPDVQARLIEEIDKVRAQLNGGPMTLDALNDMPYMDMVLKETLRKWPPLGFMDRVCTKDYTMQLASGQRVPIRAGEIIYVPVFAIQRDAQLYPDPERFDPERFATNGSGTRLPSFMYQSWGLGPRSCIGQKYATMTSTAFLCALLSEFRFERCPQTQLPTRLTARGLTMAVQGGVHVRLVPRRSFARFQCT